MYMRSGQISNFLTQRIGQICARTTVHIVKNHFSTWIIIKIDSHCHIRGKDFTQKLHCGTFATTTKTLSTFCSQLQILIFQKTFVRSKPIDGFKYTPNPLQKIVSSSVCIFTYNKYLKVLTQQSGDVYFQPSQFQLQLVLDQKTVLFRMARQLIGTMNKARRLKYNLIVLSFFTVYILLPPH